MALTRFTLRQLDIFAAVMQTGQVRRAAEQMNLSQAAVSQSLRELAGALDVTLFTRDGRALQATAAARQLLALSQAPRHALADITESLHGTGTAELSGQVRIAASSTIARYLLPAALAPLIRSAPALRLELAAGNSADIEAQVAAGEADIGFIEGPALRDDIVATRWRTDTLVIIGPVDGPNRIDAAALTEHRWIAREAGSGTRSVFEHSLALAGHAPPPPAAIIDDSGAQIRAVAAGAGLACVSHAAAQSAIVAGDIQQVALETIALARPLWRVQARRDTDNAMLARILNEIDAALG